MDEARLVVCEDERAVRELVEQRDVAALAACLPIDPLAMESFVDDICALLAHMELTPEVDEPVVVLAATERARPVTGCERRRLVEEEQLREAARLHERPSVPAMELEPTRDPALHGEPSADASLGVVKAATVPVHEAPRGIGDQLAEWGDAILARHRHVTVAPSG